MKEGFEKDFFDSLQIFDEQVPLLILLEPAGKNSFPHKFIYPSLYSFDHIEPCDVLTSNEILNFALSYDSLQPLYRSENLTLTQELFP
jgi:hypothetical protein